MQFAVERALQLAIQVVVDIATHILSTAANLTPEDYRDAILNLAEAGVIPSDYANRIAGMAGFRNVLGSSICEHRPSLGIWEHAG
jgi:uncharacterized protein YutE (UPF0331/DUF86 family)